MTRFLIYLFPAVADVVVASALFVCGNRLADAGLSKTAVATIFSAWAIVYIIGNQILARIVTSRNAAKLLIAANLMFVVTAGAFVILSQIWAMYVVMGVQAIATAMFFMPFQIFMKASEPDQHQGVVRSVALYNLAWSLGFACGPLIAGFIYQEMGWQWCHAFNGLMGLVGAGGIFLLRHHAKHHHDEAAPPEQITKKTSGDAINYHDFPNLLWLGWIGGGIGGLVIWMIGGLMPSLGVEFNIPKSQVGLIIFLIYVTQGLVCLGFIRSKTWMYRARPIAGFAIFGLLSIATFSLSLLETWDGELFFGVPLRTLLLCVAAVFYGVFSSSFYFTLVFHALVHPNRSARYVAINESIVGLCGITGPILAGVLADIFNNFIPFAVAGVLLIGATLFQTVKLRAIDIPKL